MRALVVGADGFVGRWLVRHLVESGDEVDAIVGPRFRPPLEGARLVPHVDVRDYDQLAPAVIGSAADAVYYLAAISVAGGREQVDAAARIGLVGAVHTLVAGAARDLPPRLLLVSSSHVYGGGDKPLGEDAPVEPVGVYGATKVATERALLALAPATGCEVVVARPFNHIGPGQAVTFVVPSLASRIRSIPPGSRGRVAAGALDIVRDFTDVRDVARAYRLLATHGEPGQVYNVASGTGTSVGELVAMMLELAGVEADVEVDPALAREGERRVMVGDASRIEGLGWRRTHSLRDTLAEVLDEEPTDRH